MSAARDAAVADGMGVEADDAGTEAGRAVADGTRLEVVTR
jgi:hypothetical protein